MNEGPEIRIIGAATAEKKKQVQKEIEQAFSNHFDSLLPRMAEQLRKLEYPKSKTELALTDLLMREAGVKPYDVSAKNYHIVSPELYKKIAGDRGSATTFSTNQGIFFEAQYFRDNPVYFGAVALHETFHLKGHLSLEVNEEGDKVNKTAYREGMIVNALQIHGSHGQYHQHFNGLYEAIAAAQEKKSLAKLLQLPELAKEREWLMSNEAKELKKKLAEKEEIPEDDIIWIGKKGEKDWETIHYPQQRQVLDYVCGEIQKQFPDQFQTVDDVFKEFLKSHFTGELLPIARLVERTFGEGGFRLLGNMDTDPKSGVLHLESLRNARARQIKPKTT